MPASASDSPVSAGPSHFWEWIRVVRRARLGFYDSAKKDPKKWVSSKVVQHVAVMAVTYGDYPDGTNIRPSTSRLARVCDVDERTVRACLRRLRGLQLLECVREHRPPGRNGGEGQPAEYRLTMPADLLKRVAHLDPDERHLVVPDGADMPPEKRPRRTKQQGAAPHDSEREGAPPPDSPAPGLVDNQEVEGAAPRTSRNQPANDGVQPAETEGAAHGKTGCGTRPPNQSPNQPPSQDETSRNHLADLEGRAAEQGKPAAGRDRLVEPKPLAADCPSCGTVLDPDGSCFACPTEPQTRPPASGHVQRPSWHAAS